MPETKFEMRADQFAVGQRYRPQLILRSLRVGQQSWVRLIVVTRDFCQHAQLLAGQFAVRNGDAQHRRITLDIPAVLQPQWLELFFPKRAGEVTLQLVTELVRAVLNELTIESCVLIHSADFKRH